MDKEKAIEKAKKLGCVDLVPDPTLRGTNLVTYFQETKSEKERRLKEQSRKDELRRTTFTFGKHNNKTYQEVSEIDSEYLHWAYNNSEADKKGIENTTYWKNKLAEEEKEKNALLEIIEKARKSGEIELTILDNPNEYGICQLLDAGANPEAKPEHLVTYAVMGAVYSHYVLGVKQPKIGIMSNGEEDEKGTKFTKETFALIKDLESSGKAPFDFVGNVEGHDLFESDLNVVLCDGFTGNIILKSCEATAKAMSKWLKVEFKRNPLRILGAIIAKGAFKAVKKKSSYEYVGGSPLLGVNGVCIIGHGGSSALAIENAIRVARETVTLKVNPHIEEMLDRINPGS